MYSIKHRLQKFLMGLQFVVESVFVKSTGDRDVEPIGDELARSEHWIRWWNPAAWIHWLRCRVFGHRYASHGFMAKHKPSKEALESSMAFTGTTDHAPDVWKNDPDKPLPYDDGIGFGFTSRGDKMQGKLPFWRRPAPVWMKRTERILTVIAWSMFLSYLFVFGWPKNNTSPTQAETITQLEERVKKLEEDQAGLFEAAVSNAEITGINTGNITNLVKALDDLIKQVRAILDIIQRNAVSLLELPLQPSR